MIEYVRKWEIIHRMTMGAKSYKNGGNSHEMDRYALRYAQ